MLDEDLLQQLPHRRVRTERHVEAHPPGRLGVDHEQLPWAEHDAFLQRIIQQRGTVGNGRVAGPDVHAFIRFGKQFEA